MKQSIRLSIAIYCLAVTFLIGAPGLSVATIETSYHGQLGAGSGLGMLEKWCALPNFSYVKQGGIGDGTFGWTSKDCNNCHVGAAWNPTRPQGDCTFCHVTPNATPTIADCYRCHSKDTAKRGDLFDAAHDVHIADGMLCHDCHERVNDGISDHQFLKGTAIDTTDPTMEGTLSCQTCHGGRPHHGHAMRAGRLDHHTDSVACETCHTGARPAAALMARDWTRFTMTGSPVTTMRTANWAPAYKWYDNVNVAMQGGSHLPLLDYTDRRNRVGAKIYPFNPVSVSWYVETAGSTLDDVIIVPHVKAADANADRITTLDEMRVSYPDATLVTADMNFSISHSVTPSGQASHCADCHGAAATQLNWVQLGYAHDPWMPGALMEVRITPDDTDFGSVRVNSRGVRHVEISSIGTADLSVTDVGLARNASGDYALELAAGAQPCGATSFILLPQTSCTFDLLYAPDRAGGSSVALEIASNDSDLADAEVIFSAAAVDAGSGTLSAGSGGGCSLQPAARSDYGLAILALLSGFVRLARKTAPDRKG